MPRLYQTFPSRSLPAGLGSCVDVPKVGCCRIKFLHHCHGLRLKMRDTVLLLAMNGLIWGLIIALIALGLSIIFGLLDIINIAHGDFFMVGTVLASFSLSGTGNFSIGFLVAPLIGLLLPSLTPRP